MGFGHRERGGYENGFIRRTVLRVSDVSVAVPTHRRLDRSAPGKWDEFSRRIILCGSFDLWKIVFMRLPNTDSATDGDDLMAPDS